MGFIDEKEVEEAKNRDEFENNGTIPLFGRRQIFSSVDEITKDNVIEELNRALLYHIRNAHEESYLYWYRRGMQPILAREKEIRPEICNRICENNANEIVTFKNGYFLNKPAFYTSRKNDEGMTEKIKKLNDLLYTSGKTDVDNETVNWFHTVGLGVIFVKPNKDEDEGCPVKVCSIDPRNAFVVYGYDAERTPLMGVHIAMLGKNRAVFDVYTKDYVFTIDGSYVVNDYNMDCPVIKACTGTQIIKTEKNQLGGNIPIIEYQFDENRMGAFEPVIPLMNAINTINSDVADGIEQFIQSLMVLKNCQLAEGVDAKAIRQKGLVELKSTNEAPADLIILSEQLDQTQTAITLENLHSQMYAKAGVPRSDKATGSTSDNVGAVYLRDGFAVADTHARNTEDLFKKSNRKFDKVFLAILKGLNVLSGITLADFDLCFPRNDMNNLLTKAQVALNLKQLGLSPELVLERSGLSNDPVSDIELSRKYIDIAFSTEDKVSHEAKTPIEKATTTNNVNQNTEPTKSNEATGK